jgi:hypothetical protein
VIFRLWLFANGILAGEDGDQAPQNLRCRTDLAAQARAHADKGTKNVNAKKLQVSGLRSDLSDQRGTDADHQADRNRQGTDGHRTSPQGSKMPDSLAIRRLELFGDGWGNADIRGDRVSINRRRKLRE